MNEHTTFRERLMDMEPMTPSLRERYEREVGMLLEKKLTTPRKWGMMAVIVMLLGQVVFFGYAMFAFHGLPLLGRIVFGVGVLFALSFAAVLVSIIRRGTYNLKTDSNTITGITWIFLVIMITLFMLLSGRMHDPVKGISMVLNGLVFFIMGVVFLLQNNIHQAQLKTQEKLLEIELRIVELAEKLEK